MTIENINQEFDNIARIRQQMIEPVKLQLHSGIEGFDSPESFAIYRKTGGKALGTVGRVYEPPNLNHFVDSITKSICECCPDHYNLSDLKYTEYKGGSKVSFDLPGETFEVKSQMLGDVFQTKVHFFTGFDGLTKTSIGYSVLRLKCLNGNKKWDKDIELSFKNTIGNVGKIEYFGHQIIQLRHDLVNYNELLNQLSRKDVNQDQVNTFMKRVLGYDQSEYKELTAIRRNKLDKINQSVAIEQRDLGMNMYTLLQGITRYTTHELSDSDEDTFFGGAATMNEKAHSAALAVLN